MNIKLLSQEVIDGDLHLDGSFMDIDPKFIKFKKVNGSVLLTGGKWTEIPAWLKNVEISGGFYCSNNKLKTLKNCPQKIGVDFDCNNNQLDSLDYCPKIINGRFMCSINNLTSLEGCPKIVVDNFNCSYNKLTSLEGCPENIKGNFDCMYNDLISLEGCPEYIGGDFQCYENKTKLDLPNFVKLKGKFINYMYEKDNNIEKDRLLNIKYMQKLEVIDGDLELDESFMDIDPKFVKLKKVNGDVWLTGGHWTEIPIWLKDVEIEGNFNCPLNKLTTLKNCPQKIEGDFDCHNNQLISLEGCPETIVGSFSCSGNKLISLEGCPENIGEDFWYHDNKIELELPDYVKLKGFL